MLTCDTCSKQAPLCECHMRDQRVWGYLGHWVKQGEGQLHAGHFDTHCTTIGRRVQQIWPMDTPRVIDRGICGNPRHYRVTDGMAQGDTGCPVIHLKVGRHNMAHRRIDVWFKGPDGFVWWGVDCGNGPRCRRTKESWVARVFDRAAGKEG